MYSYITVKIYSVNIIENRCTFVENKNEFFLSGKKWSFFPHTLLYICSRLYQQLESYAQHRYNLHTASHSLRVCIYISMYSNRLVLILTNIPDLGHLHKSCLPQFFFAFFCIVHTIYTNIIYIEQVLDMGKSISLYSPVTKTPQTSCVQDLKI